jgi:hypothetical protein
VQVAETVRDCESLALGFGEVQTLRRDRMDRIRLILSERTGGCLCYAECNGTASTMGTTVERNI